MTYNLVGERGAKELSVCHTFRLFYNSERGGFLLKKDLLAPHRFGEGDWYISPHSIYDGSVEGLKSVAETNCEGVISLQCFQATLNSYNRLSTNLAVFSTAQLYQEREGGVLKLSPYLWNRVNPADESDLLIVLTTAEGISIIPSPTFSPKSCFLDLAVVQINPSNPPN